MMGGLTPLQGIQGIDVIDDPQPFATPEERSGGVADPRHGIPGEQAEPYPWNLNQGVQYGALPPIGIENQMLGFDYADDVDPAGTLSQDPTADLTPASAAGGYITHAAPWPKGTPMDVGPDTNAARLQESYSIHSADTGADRDMSYAVTLDPLQDDWREIWDVQPGTTLQSSDVPAQVGFAVGGFGSRDRAQSLAGQNQYGFDSSHAHRRYAESPIPGNNMWMEPGGRPMMKTVGGYPNRFPTGPNSPFTGDDTGAAFNGYGAILDELPGEYQAPPEPALSAPLYNDAESPGVELW